VLSIIIALQFIIIIALGGYGHILLNNQLLELNNKLEITKIAINSDIEVINKEVRDVNQELTKNTNTLVQSILDLEKESMKSTKALLNLIKEVENQSNIELEKVKKDIQIVGVSAGDFSQIVQDVLPSVVSVITEKGQGSGAFITNDGDVVTNNHVILNANNIRIYTYDKELFNAIVVMVDSSLDIAVLKINASYSPLEFDDSSNIKVGEKVIALGNPGGLGFTVTEGIISAVDRKVSNSLPGFIQIDVALNPGNSGGPLVNSRGKIIGINNFKIGGGFEALGFAIPSNVVKKSIGDFLS
ncbi:MAG: trypsin-like peptidase domain-containing protein, partial [Nanoarchaeota archaeon]